MKKFLQLLTMLLFALFIPVMVFAQGEVVVPGFDFGPYFASLAAMVPLVVLITAWLKKVLKVNGIWIQIVSWILSITLCFVGYLLHIGLFADITQWWLVLIYGFCVGLSANGFFDITIIQQILKGIGLEPKNK